MTQTEYEQKRAECWIEFCREHPIETPSMAIGEAFCAAFDRAYALGKEKETITQKEIEKAWQDYAQEIGLPESLNYATRPMIEIAIKQAFKAGAKLNGKQEKDAKSMCLSDVKQKIDAWMDSHTEEEVYERLKKYSAVEDADTVIQGWVCRDKVINEPFTSDLFLAFDEPTRIEEWGKWGDMGDYIELDSSLFPDLTWESEPEQVEITIKRKKK